MPVKAVPREFEWIMINGRTPIVTPAEYRYVQAPMEVFVDGIPLADYLASL